MDSKSSGQVDDDAHNVRVQYYRSLNLGAGQKQVGDAVFKAPVCICSCPIPSNNNALTQCQMN